MGAQLSLELFLHPTINNVSSNHNSEWIWFEHDKCSLITLT
uniref:Uncharacterized protein n=1 Tax=Rhizophora mucronata TaxID=61149 RepID=A0A2P2QS30_RHIMU